MMQTTLIALAGLAMSCSAQAASFDCAKAGCTPQQPSSRKTTTEKESRA